MATNGSDEDASVASCVNDDFRTAFDYLKKSGVARSPGPSAAALQTALSVAEVDRQLIDAFNKLTDMLRRNLRVRYELSISDIVKVSVILTSILGGLMCKLIASPHFSPIPARSTVEHPRID